MKNLVTIFCAVLLLIIVGLGCKNNPLAKFTKQYQCTIEGEPEDAKVSKLSSVQRVRHADT